MKVLKKKQYLEMLVVNVRMRYFMNDMMDNFHEYRRLKKLRNARYFITVYCFIKMKRWFSKFGGILCRLENIVRHKLSFWAFIKQEYFVAQNLESKSMKLNLYMNYIQNVTGVKFVIRCLAAVQRGESG